MVDIDYKKQKQKKEFDDVMQRGIMAAVIVIVKQPPWK